MNEPQPGVGRLRAGLPRSRFGWRWVAALGLLAAALAGFLSGVGLSERPDVGTDGLLVKTYYALGLFVFGGLDVGFPVGGPWLGRVALWLAYFGAPLLTASAVIEALMRVMMRDRWHLRRLSDHVVVVGAGFLTLTYLRVLRQRRPDVPVVVLVESIEPTRRQELEEGYGVRVVVGDPTHEFMLRLLRLRRASRVVLLPDDNFLAFEAATKMLRLYPRLESRIVLHSHNLRFLRTMQETSVGRRCICFNCYHLAASGLVRDYLVDHFQKTGARDVVVLAGFGRFGQTILEELQERAAGEFSTVGLIDLDAERRILVAHEQGHLSSDYRRVVVQGHVGHPEVWRQLAESVDLSRSQPTVILGTGLPEENLRAAMWVKRRWPNALVFARTNDVSLFATEVGEEHGINSISITRLVEDHIPESWLG
ncbi:MAG: potassium transporter TrkA [Gammaproteobacteria bacterium]|jgi:Trk K+ transport system NAD-binding subunit|nr:potassium transporter TrkA [Gammaproteobacteria bacterium]MBK81141.1 potassium transporter TrkA [Gammaproteobacteria bacterium]|tara:strand:- start:4357 stop:5625 length:1269 start_codon:yes stop_codon:yes gene_type:complete